MSPKDHDEIVRESFRRQVGLFSGPDSPFAQREGMLGWLEPLDADMLALEVACGAAHVAETAARRVRQIVGIDLTRELLDLGAGRLREAGIANVLLQEGNVEALPFVDGSFDLVYCRVSLHHFGDPRTAVAEMVRVARLGGRVVLMDLVAPSEAERDVFDHLHRLIDPSHVRSLLESELADVFPNNVTLSYGNTQTTRLPFDAIVTEQSDCDTVLAALRAELAGGPATAFDPAEEDGRLSIAVTTCTLHGDVG